MEVPDRKIPCMFFDVSGCSWTEYNPEKAKCTLGFPLDCNNCANHIPFEIDPVKIAAMHKLVQGTEGLLNMGFSPADILKATLSKFRRKEK